MNISLRVITPLCVALLMLAGCGAETKTGSNGTGSAPPPEEAAVASGALVGLGPLGLAGASLQDAGTQVLLNVSARPGTVDLRLGMTANAIGTVAAGTASGKASGAVAQSLAVGPVMSVDPAGRRLSVLSLTLDTDQNTLLEGVTALEQIVPGDRVEVFGLPLATPQRALATRIIVRRTAVAEATVEMLGVITAVTPLTIVVQGLVVNVHSAQIGVSSAAGVVFGPAPATTGLTQGLLVRVIGTLDGAGGIIATSVASSLAPARSEGSTVFIEGFVTTVRTNVRFAFADLEVDAPGTGSTAGITAGARVRVRGKMQGGVLRAEATEVIQAGFRAQYFLEGTVENYTSLGTFMVRGEVVDASQATFTQGAAANLANGRLVRVKGFAGPGRLQATEIAVAN